ncbi:hypothetical protein DFH07DRAFT_788416 [Mycena maculata]|uniref:Mid2 domain-containing protein n=1 Tax=Mycena maculata TaxID=230809 RepID=A0AAD7KEH0_9AGAR|nr:hypothetical protein DFH07DRAFT_788416 [Mycena maculata]
MLLNPKNLSLTLFVSTLLTLAVTSVEANDFAQPNHRAHDNLKRLIRKRAPQDSVATALAGVGAVAGVGADPETASATPSASASASASAASASASVAESATSASVATSASAASASAESASVSTSASASVASASASSAPPTTSTSTATTEQTTAPAQETANTAPTTTAPKSTITETSSVLADAAAATNSVSPSSAASTNTKRTVTTVIIVVAASVGGLAILWTIFRKWKLGHSSKFDERMAPIDWQPTNEESIVPAHRRANSRASSFQSSANHDNAAGAGAYHDRNRSLEHDFSAPPANLAPVGGYADLARGSSPQPPMQETLGRGPSMRSYNDGLARGPSQTRPTYDNGVPLHHQAGYGQAEAYDYNGDAVRF